MVFVLGALTGASGMCAAMAVAMREGQTALLATLATVLAFSMAMTPEE